MTLRGRVRFKAEGIWDAPDDGYRYEVIDGELFLSPAPSWKRQRASGRLFGRLLNHILAHQLGEIVHAPTGVVIRRG